MLALLSAAQSVPEPVAQQGEIGWYRVTHEADFLALRETAGNVVHGHFERSVAVHHELTHELDVEVEAVAFEIEALQAFGAEHLEHRVHVRGALLVEQIEGRRENQLPRVQEHALQGVTVELTHLPVVEP